MRAGSSALVAAAFIVLAAPAGATKPARACIDAHAEAQVDRDAGRLLRARERFLSCASEPCPGMIRKECAELAKALLPLVPSIVLVAQDVQGKPLTGAHASIDANRNVPAFDATPIELDPGVHRIDVALPDGRRQVFDLSLGQSEKSRRVVATFAPGKPVKAPEASGNELAYVLGGVGLLALGTWAAFAYDGRNKQADLENCAPRCTNRSEVDAMRRSYLVADVLLGVSLAALGTSGYLLISSAGGDNRSAGRSVLVGASGRF